MTIPTEGMRCSHHRCTGADPGKLQGEGHESKWCPLPIPKIKNSSDFGHLILVMPYFQFFIFIFILFLFLFLRPVVPLGTDRPVVPLGTDRPVVPLGPDRPVVPLTSLGCP